jgi:hypothetical protein
MDSCESQPLDCLGRNFRNLATQLMSKTSQVVPSQQWQVSLPVDLLSAVSTTDCPDATSPSYAFSEMNERWFGWKNLMSSDRRYVWSPASWIGIRCAGAPDSL